MSDHHDEVTPRPIPRSGGGPNPEAVEALIRDPQAMLCLCEGVRVWAVVAAIREEQPTRVAQVTRSCGAGKGCGSCHVLIQTLIDRLNPDRGS